MKRLFLVVFLFGAIAVNAIAHNAKIATYTLRDTGAGWFVEMNFAQSAIDAQMIKIHGKDRLQEIDENDYKNLFLSYLRDNFKLRVDGKKVEFENGGILLGSHQTDVKFVLPEIPLNPKYLSVYLPMFEDVYNQTNLFRIYRGGESFTKFFLSEDNEFSVNAEITSNGIIAVDQPVTSNSIAVIAGGMTLLILIISTIALFRSRIQNSKFSKA
ncbi:hypothetical protein [Ekhidna sp.]